MPGYIGLSAPQALLSGNAPRLDGGLGKLGGLSLAVVGVVGIACGAVLAAASEVGPFATAFWRMAVTVPACLLLLMCRPGGLQLGRVVKPLSCKHVWIAAPAFAATLMLWYAGQRLSSIATTSAMVNLSPIFVMACVWLRYDHRPTARVLAGIALAISGAGALALHSNSVSGQSLAGDALALMGAATLAIYYLCVTRMCRQTSALEAMLLIAAIATPILWVVASQQSGPVAPASISGWMTVVLLAIVGQVGGQAALAAASRSLGALGTSAAALGEPAVAAALAALFLAAPIYPLQAAGIAAVAAGIWMCQVRWSGTDRVRT